jgi:LacI family transcriptional regulator|nr:LacI family DNA-binding transcriptional regulator [Anaerotruncus rubiinfantis]
MLLHVKKENDNINVTGDKPVDHSAGGIHVPKVTLQDIADELQLSKSLISKIINNRDVRVSDEVRKKVLDKIKEYNYVPNRVASALSSKKMNLIACIVTNTNYDFYTDLVFYIEQEAFRQGYNIILCNIAENTAREANYLKLYQSGLIDGILASSSDGTSNRELYEQIHHDGFPIVFVDRYIPDTGISVVATENRQGAYILTQELIQKGHKRISFVGYDFATKTTVQKNRYMGYARAMEENGLTQQLLYAAEEGERSLERALQEDRPTALVMISSWQIPEILKLCRKYGMKVPRDLSIATFDEFRLPYNSMNDIQTTRVVEEPLIILKQDVQALARAAVDVLIDQINGVSKEEIHKFIPPYFE